MNLVIKSSIITLLTAAAVSSVSASICIDTGNDAAELVILENWCEPDFFSKGNPTPEERCRKVAIRTCQSGTTLRDIINDWCPDKQPSNTDIFNLGDYCEDTVDGLIGNASFVATKTKAKDSDYEASFSFVSKASKTHKPTRSPTRPPTPDSSVVSGFRAGQQAMQQWWKDEGSSCSNAWSGIINPAANEIKNSQFPNKGSSNTRARNKSAQLGVDSEVRSIQDKCFSADADEFIAAPAPIELDPLAAPTPPSPVPPLELHPTPRFVAAPEPAPTPKWVIPSPRPAPQLEMSRRALRGHSN